MTIDFKSTYDSNEMIHFCDAYGTTLRTYPMSDLENYVALNGLDQDVFGIVDPNYIDNEWFSICEKFYNSLNPVEYQAKYKPQQTQN